MVSLYGGRIEVKSALNKGSEFYFTIKLKRVAKKEVIEITDFELLKGKKALIAEDTPLNAMLMRKVLTNWGIDTDHAKDGKAALEASKKNAYDFILMDVHMPVMNGFEATRLIKTTANKNQKTPVFAVTADVLTSDNKESTHLFDAILWKPLEIDKLFKALSNCKLQKRAL
ncbi:response regulator [Lacinutrix neustonica]|uniref:Response regulator n=1 Tax=Lacinutrix neustonica TaxID=2980107 RepID=A0A9E8MYJ5_9FLAO|nr:response regulator [Lacinutrix neustonica]WAC03249.1 response regulator [Lacinutrix neustonica]